VPPNEDAPRGVAPGALSALLQELARPGEGDGAWERGLRPGAVIGRFELVRELGRGGFGVVYEARDRELGRSVAFKAIVAGARGGASEQRLIDEAEAAARLSHPNIVTLYDAGRSEHGPYLVLELLRGRTLAQRLALGALSPREALRVAVQVARGLAHAHAQGVVHRDLTPGNVFLCHDGQVKVLDLGLAHAFGRRKVEGGTAAFMAPEQERGAPEDERTDVFALGVVLYRMLAGELPHRAAGPAPAAAAPRVDVGELPALGDLVARMLAQDPVERPRDGAEVAAALEALSSELDRVPPGHAPSVKVQVRAAPRPASVGVLPFADLSPARDQEWLCDGIAEEILHVLAGLADLRVASRSASFQFKGRTVDGREMARAIGVTTLLEGSVRKAGQRVRITARLVGEDGYEIWSQSFDRVLEDVFAVQDEIAQAVARRLEVRLSSGEVRRLQRSGTRNARALELYLKARRLQPWASHNHPEARDHLERAIRMDPGFAEAHAELADGIAWLLQWRTADDADGALRREALAASEEALRLDPGLAEAHVARANLLALGGRAAEAEDEFRRALALNPGLSKAWYYHGRFLFAAGRLSEAAPVLEECARLDPEDYNPLALLPQIYRTLGDRDGEASASERAMSVAERWLQLNPDDVRAMYLVASAYARRGDRARSFAWVERALAQEPDNYGVLYNGACSYALAGETERALDLLDRAVATGRGYRSWIEKDSDFDSIRAHPRFADMLARLPR
jgi:TolB-like protein/Tfp pilus assembly protein PilF